MCLVLFLGTETPLETSGWSKETPAFYVGNIALGEVPVRQHFNKPLVYYLGSHTQCGCGFDYDSSYAEARGDEADDLESRRQLVKLLRSLTEGEGEVEVFACWSGDEAEEVIERKRVRPEDLFDRRILDEGHFLTIVKDAA